MRATWFDTFGPADTCIQMGELPMPSPLAGEVLIRLETSGVNPSDVKKRAGSFPNLLDGGLVIPHSDGAGIIEAVGEDVNQSRVGERVWVYQAQFGRRFGTGAEYVAIDRNRAPLLPENTDFNIGACLGIPAMTAHRCVFADGPVKGQRLLITGGAGRVGYYAIQWAKSAGATVITTASNEADKSTCEALGADLIVNHRDGDWAEQILHLSKGQQVDRVIDVEFGQNLPQILKLIRTSGTIATYSSTVVQQPQLPFLEIMYKDLMLRFVIVYAMPEAAKQAAITDINAALEKEALQHRIAAICPLKQTAAAHELVEMADTRGCVIISTQS